MITRVLGFLCLAFAAVPAASAAALAAAPPWIALGPYGGTVNDAAWSPTNPQVALVAAGTSSFGSGGLFRSVDSGLTWTRVEAIGVLAVNDIEFNAAGKAWIATSDSVWDSIDAGETWTRRTLFGAPGGIDATDVALDPSNPLVVWAAIDDGGTYANVVFRSVDGGASWQPRSPPLTIPVTPLRTARAIAVDPANSNLVVVAISGLFGGGQVWVSGDAGANWIDRSAGLTQNRLYAIVHQGSRILVAGGQPFPDLGVGLFSSTNQGLSWAPVHNDSWGPYLAAQDVFVDPASPNQFWAATHQGVHRTSNAGGLWQVQLGGTGVYSFRSIRRKPGTPATLMFGLEGKGVLRTTDNGITFALANKGINELSTSFVDTSPLDSQRIAIAQSGENDGAIYTSNDGGTTWTRESANSTRYSAVKFASDGTLFALTGGPTSGFTGGVFKKLPNGMWDLLGPGNNGIVQFELAAMHVDSASGLVIVAGSDFGSSGFNGGIWRLLPGGSWERAYTGASGDFVEEIQVVDSGGGGRAFLATWTNVNGPAGGLLRSTNEGGTWTPVTTGLPPASGTRNGRLCVLPGAPQTVVQVLNNPNARVFRSTDAGQSWQPTGYAEASGFAADVACDPSGTGTVLIGRSEPPSVVRSDDGGSTFVPYGNGIEIGNYVTRMTIGATGSRPARAYVAATKGIYTVDPNPPFFADGFEAP